MRILALLALCIAAVTAAPANPQKIAGGVVTSIGQYPSIASVLYSWNSVTYLQTCGGVILNNRAVLTAAHCPIGDTALRWRFRVGSASANSGGFSHTLNQVIIHPQYNAQTLDNDVAILRAAFLITFNNNVRVASIAGANYNLHDDQHVWAAGWGATFQGGSAVEQLRNVRLLSVNQAICARHYATIGATITDNMLCSGRLDADGFGQCQGDAGSPLYHNGVVVGVYSWGQGCGQAFFPGVNARVSRYITWMQSNI